MDARRRLGILAGGGTLPREIADSAVRRGMPVTIVAIDSEADGELGSHAVTRVNWGQLGGMIRALKSARVTDLVIVGRVKRPEIGIMRPDWGFFRHLPRVLRIVASGGDDGVLRHVVRFFEGQGIRVIGPDMAAPELVIGEGTMGAARATPGDQTDIKQGMALIRALGAYDIGQSVVVAEGRIEAIEGVEGTDRMLARAAARRFDPGRDIARKGGVLVKRSKPGQDLRVDMPAIGPATVKGAKEAGLAGIAVEANTVIAAERARTLRDADTAHLFLQGVTDEQLGSAQRRFNPRLVAVSFRRASRVTPAEHATLDAIKGLAVVDTLAPFSVGRAAVVVRNHVLAVETGEGAEATILRASGLRQWASITRRRRGAAILRDMQDLTQSVVSAVADAGYAGIAIGGALYATDALREAAIADAEERGLFVLVRESPQRSGA
jgi:UDP-2,3-diacylglucosamine hydrolase